MSTYSYSFSSISLLSMLFSSLVYAETTSKKQIGEDQPKGEIETIMVTAQRTSENLQDVPVAVTSLNHEKLEQFQFRTAGEIVSQIPNFAIQYPFGESVPIFAVRGVSNIDFNPNQTSPIGVYVDNVYIGPTFLHGFQMFDLDRVEVLRGPQGTLYGKNTTGGAANFFTRNPGYDQDTSLEVGYGNYNRIDVKAAQDIVLSEDIAALRISGKYTTRDGYIDNLLVGAPDNDLSSLDEWAGRATLLVEPNEDWRILLKTSVGKTDTNNYGAIVIGTGPDETDFFGASRSDLEFDETRANFDSKRILKATTASLTVDWMAMDELTVTSVTAMSNGEYFTSEDDDGSELRINENIYDSESSEFSQEIRFTSDYSGAFDWIAGLYYGTETIESDISFGFVKDDPNLGGYSVTNFVQDRESIAGFVDASYQITEKLKLTMGARLTQDKTELTEWNWSFFGTDATLPTGLDGTLYASTTLADTGLDNNLTDTDLSGRIVLDYQLSRNNLIYSSISRAYRQGVFNAVVITSPDDLSSAEGESVTAYELGVKTQFADNTVRINAAVFYYDYEDQQFLDITSDSIGTFAQTVRNAGKSTSKGAEFEITLVPTDDLRLNFGFGFLDATYDELTIAGQDLSGNELINAPGFTFNGAANWVALDNEQGLLSFNASTNYTGDQFFSAQNDPVIGQDAYWLVNGGVTYAFGEDREYSVSFWGKNLADKDYYTYGLDLSDGFGFNFFQRGEPRTFGATLKANF